jgi:fluoride ion exporter CrcB/FEX
LRTKLLLAIFLGGALGSALRYLVFLGVEGSSLTEPEIALVATSIVNLLGAFFLGVVQARNLPSSPKLAFWGTGVAGGFTTMSGLTLVTHQQNLGPFGNGTIFWLAVVLQLILGVLAFWLGRKLSGGKS